MTRSFTDPDILIDRIDDLPSLKPIISAVIGLVDCGNTQAEQLGKLLSSDAALASRILKLVNSSYYSLPQPVASISKAVVLLGFETIRSLVLSTSIVELLSQDKSAGEDLGLMWERSFFAAVAARKVARYLRFKTVEEGFMAGLLMDIGMLIQLKLHGESYGDIIRKDIHEGENVAVLEMEAYNITHEHLGNALMNRWGLPAVLSSGALYHHDMTGSQEQPSKVREIAQSVHMAQLAAAIFYSPKKRKAIQAFKAEAERLERMSPEDIDLFFKPIRDEVATISKLYGLKMQSLPSYAEILDEANQELSELNKTYEQLNQELEEAKRQAEGLAKSLRQANAQLQEVAHSDELTGLYNRRYFEKFLGKEIDRCRRYKHSLSVIMIDIDHFKAVNDTYGHPQGDSVLSELAGRMKTCLRSTDVAARYGGEEFIFILPETNLYAARITAEKLRRAVAQEPFKYKPNESLPITISLGLSCCDPAEDMEKSPKDLVKIADENLYRAKESGRNKVCYGKS
jgi:two-component system, cell cycle response regulator